ncbi:nuA3 HAT complex component nto1 [Thoreauomyces humboldtii]|nr:nuA3 HAT complex component nto1 [Thoreauomyces humboldtii]
MLERANRRGPSLPPPPPPFAASAPRNTTQPEDDLATHSPMTLLSATPLIALNNRVRKLLGNPSSAPASPLQVSEDVVPVSEAPAEERSYRDTFPDLEITKQLPLLDLSTSATESPAVPSEDVAASPNGMHEAPLAALAASDVAPTSTSITAMVSLDPLPATPAANPAKVSALVIDTVIEQQSVALPELLESALPDPPPGPEADSASASEIFHDAEEDISEQTSEPIASTSHPGSPPLSQKSLIEQLWGSEAISGHHAESAFTESPSIDSPVEQIELSSREPPQPPAVLNVYSGIQAITRIPELPPAPTNLPRPSFRELPGSEDLPPQKKLRLGAAYLRHNEPSEDELASRVEYDMDEQGSNSVPSCVCALWLKPSFEPTDLSWLEIINEQRKLQSQTQMDEDYFEQVMDILEKEWFDLTKDIPSPRDDDDTDPVCAVCDDGECENSNAIVFCDGCNIAVHQDCYGVPYIPEGQWLCRKCMLSPHKPVDCVLCPHSDGAFKQTSAQGWAHLLCAMWVPECGLGNMTLMEPVIDIEKIPRSRWRLQCYLCQRHVGAPMQCSNKSCYAAFHPTCARKAKLYMKMRSMYGTEHNTFRVFCDKHTPTDYRERVDVEGAILEFKQAMLEQTTSLVRRTLDSLEEAEDDEASLSDEPEAPRRRLKRKALTSDSEDHDTHEVLPVANRRKRKRTEGTLSAGRVLADFGIADAGIIADVSQPAQFSTAVVIPQYILRRVLETLRADFKERKRKGDFDRKCKDFVILVCKYWSLKRESRRGAPLLKRLHLEPWTASTSAMKQDEEARGQRNQTAIVIRQDLERVRLLVDLIRKREKDKMRQYQAGVSYTELLFFPATKFLRPVFEKIRGFDRDGYFADPVTAAMAPDYATYVTNPMDFSTMARKVDHYEYRDIASFEADLELVWHNCMVYNKPETEYYKAAARYQKRAKPLIDDLKAHLAGLPIDPETGIMHIAPAEFFSVLWTTGWPEEMVERPLFQKELPPVQPEKVVVPADFMPPPRLTRARLAALEAATPEPVPSRRSKKKASKSVPAKTRAEEPLETPGRRLSRGRRVSVLASENTPPPDPLNDSLGRLVRPARKAAEAAQKAIVVHRASKEMVFVLKTDPVLTHVFLAASTGKRKKTEPEPLPLTGREARARKRHWGESDTIVNTPAPAPRGALKKAKEPPSTPLPREGPSTRRTSARTNTAIPPADTDPNTSEAVPDTLSVAPSKSASKSKKSSRSSSKPDKDDYSATLATRESSRLRRPSVPLSADLPEALVGPTMRRKSGVPKPSFVYVEVEPEPEVSPMLTAPRTARRKQHPPLTPLAAQRPSSTPAPVATPAACAAPVPTEEAPDVMEGKDVIVCGVSLPSPLDPVDLDDNPAMVAFIQAVKPEEDPNSHAPDGALNDDVSRSGTPEKVSDDEDLASRLQKVTPHKPSAPAAAGESQGTQKSKGRNGAGSTRGTPKSRFQRGEEASPSLDRNAAQSVVAAVSPAIADAPPSAPSEIGIFAERNSPRGTRSSIASYKV